MNDNRSYKPGLEECVKQNLSPYGWCLVLLNISSDADIFMHVFERSPRSSIAFHASSAQARVKIFSTKCIKAVYLNYN